MCVKFVLLWRMKSVCKAFVIVENEECVQNLLLWRKKSVCKAVVIVENEECVQSCCYCTD